MHNIVQRDARAWRYSDLVKLVCLAALNQRSATSALRTLRGPGCVGLSTDDYDQARYNLMLPSVDTVRRYEEQKCEELGCMWRSLVSVLQPGDGTPGAGLQEGGPVCSCTPSLHHYQEHTPPCALSMPSP
jgi:hypothetical protein